MTRSLLVVTAMVLLPGLTACTEEVSEEEFTTEFSVLSPIGNLDAIEVVKRFRFSKDPDNADSVIIVRAELSILSPSNVDFAFIDRLEVFTDLGDERALIASTGDYRPGQSTINLNIDFARDLREFTEDNRLAIVFRAYPSRWFGEWPEDGFRIQAHMVLEMDLF
jgi:hypothetical protein